MSEPRSPIVKIDTNLVSYNMKGMTLKEQRNQFSYNYYFLFCSHGATLTKHNIEMNTKLFEDFDTLNFFTFNNSFLSLEFDPSNFNINFVKYLINNPLFISSGTKNTGRNVPPLIFSATEEDRHSYYQFEAMGLWFVDYTKKTPTMTRVMNFHDLLQLSIKKNYNITYSVLDQELKKYIKLFKEKQIITNEPNVKIGLGFLCCRSKPEQHARFYNQIVQKIYPTLITERTLYTRDDLIQISQENGYKFKAFFFKPWFVSNLEHLAPIVSEFETLALGITHQGCGLNVLTFYKFIDAAFAENSVLCLTAKGSSIFNILQYMNYVLTDDAVNDSNIIAELYKEEYEKDVPINITEEDAEIFNRIRETLNEPRRPTRNNYIIIRHEIQTHLHVFFNTINSSPNYRGDLYKAIIVKLYPDLYNPRVPGQFSHIGHTVSFYFTYSTITNSNTIILIDPQTKNYINVLNPEFNKYLEKGGFKYFDVIYHNDGVIGNTPSEILSSLDQYSETSFIVPFDPRINYGGSKTDRRQQQSRISPTGVWELDEEGEGDRDTIDIKSMKTYNITRAIPPSSIIKIDPDVSKNNYKIFMEYIRTNDIRKKTPKTTTLKKYTTTKTKNSKRRKNSRSSKRITKNIKTI